ncbi:hypothetical protein JYU34_022009 [Plutella xylostella]|uniref:NADH dehydrogenase [ubiquinone] 1 alpha subcomplex assembly factor 3 n=1 Tax=Plutella xylostella TaxID=51655 RepID=A0ABQ7PTA7_PLUXY|nr:hypothetical protein JYU34_022009 [Plutella xylostella]
MLANALRQVNLGKISRTPLLSGVRYKNAYQGEGKTTVRVINQETELGLMIDTYATYGFRLNNGVTVLGPMAIFPRTVFSWQVDKAADITPESLRFFKILEPKIDLLILGLETNDRTVISSVFKSGRAAGLNIEILPIEHAASTFNFLNAEGRSVAGAMLPPLTLHMSDDDMLRAGMHYNNLYDKDLK